MCRKLHPLFNLQATQSLFLFKGTSGERRK
nr:MAG TPA: hypothetical protein [Bacteriophage sp.]